MAVGLTIWRLLHHSNFCLRTPNTNGVAQELRADPNALANGTYDAPSKPYKGRKPEAAPNGPSSSDRPLAGNVNMHMHVKSLIFCPAAGHACPLPRTRKNIFVCC